MADQIIVEESKEQKNVNRIDEAKKAVKNFFAQPWVHVGIGVAAGLIVKPVAAAAKQLVLELLGSDEPEAADNCPDNEQEEMPF